MKRIGGRTSCGQRDPQIEPAIQLLCEEETRAAFDAEARRVLGIGGEAFLRRYDASDFRDIHQAGENVDVSALELLNPLDQ